MDRNPESEDVVRMQLKELDPLLDLRWMDHVRRYALVCQWPQVDRRWEMYQSGEIGAPEDILGWFTDGIQDAEGRPVDPLEMMDRMRVWLGKMDNTSQDWKVRMRRSIEHNAELRRKRQEAIVDETMEEVKHFKKLHLGEGIVNLGDGTKESIYEPSAARAVSAATERRTYNI